VKVGVRVRVGLGSSVAEGIMVELGLGTSVGDSWSVGAMVADAWGSGLPAHPASSPITIIKTAKRKARFMFMPSILSRLELNCKTYLIAVETPRWGVTGRHTLPDVNGELSCLA
jgi:hypothetical protein